MINEAEPQRTNRIGSTSIYMMKRLMHEELIKTVAERESKCATQPQDLTSGNSLNRESVFIRKQAPCWRSESLDRSESSSYELNQHPVAVRSQSNDQNPSINNLPNAFDIVTIRSDMSEDRRSEGEAGSAYNKLDLKRTVSVDPDRGSNPPEKALEISAVLSSLIIQDLSQQYKQLPILEGFLEKLSPNKSMLKIWQTRFFFIDDDRLCYSRDFIEVENRQRSEYQGLIINRISFLLMLCISGDPRNRQFFIEVHDPKRSDKTRQYILRAKTVQDRDRWLEGIKLYAKHCRDVIQLRNISPQSSPSISKYYESIKMQTL